MTTRPEVMLAVPVPETTDHTPEAVASVKAGVVDPTQTVSAPPPIAATTGSPLTVSDLVTAVEHPFVVTV